MELVGRLLGIFVIIIPLMKVKVYSTPLEYFTAKEKLEIVKEAAHPLVARTVKIQRQDFP